MAIGKYLSLEEARKKGKLERFAKEHPSVAHAHKKGLPKAALNFTTC